jgi:hypothetical protein
MASTRITSFFLRNVLLAAIVLVTAGAPPVARDRTVCPTVYIGVCCKYVYGYHHPTVYKEVANECICSTQFHGSVVSVSFCPPTTTRTTTTLNCFCTKEFRPVCCRKNGISTTVGNACVCRCTGGAITNPGGACVLTPTAV